MATRATRRPPVKYRDSNKERSILNIKINVTEEFAELIFEDNGIGVPAHLLPNIFKMFFRGTERSEGAGLGLYIVKETIDKLQGKIEVHSVHNISTEFKLQIPNRKKLASAMV